MKFLLHICCANCALVPLETLLRRSTQIKRQTNADISANPPRNQPESAFQVILFWYNPNIHPKEEYEKRLADVKRLADIYHLSLVIGDYEKEKWFELVKGLGKEPEGGKRCQICFRMRLEKTGGMARDKNFDYFSTTLGISKYKNTDIIDQIGQELAEKYGIKYYQFEVNKNEAFRQELELSKKYNFYRQKYCGCIFSIFEKNKVH